MSDTRQPTPEELRWRTLRGTKLLQFFSVAALTQVILILSQLILLPIQIRMWGHRATAAWYSAIALATITTVVDCGLRTAGHAELVRFIGQPTTELAAGEHFQQVWGWIRVLVVVLTLALIVGDAVYTTGVKGSPYPLWKAALTFAYALETVLIIRIVYLDTLGFYRGAEASYFMFAALRLAFAVPALLLFHLEANGLAWLFLATSVVALGLQGWLLCRPIGVLGAFAPLPRKLSIRVLAVARYTLAEPCANWVRLSLPVLVISVISHPAAVTTYVALRATFGAGRTTIQQLARVASVEYLRFRGEKRSDAAESLLSSFVLAAGFFGAAVASVVIVDNMRVLGLWLTRFDRSTFQTIALSFAPSAAFYSYQIVLSLMFRVGELAWIARRHYAYVIYCAVFAGVVTQVKWLPLYLGMLVVSEVVLSCSFMLPGIKDNVAFPIRAGRRGILAALAGSICVLLLWFAARHDLGGIFGDFSLRSVLASASVLALVLATLAAIIYFTNSGLFRTVPLVFRRWREVPPISGTGATDQMNQNL